MRPLKRAAAVFAACAFATAGAILPHAVASADATDGGARPPVAIADAGADARPRVSRTPPDPPAMSENVQWVFDLRWERGDVFLVAVHKTDMGGPHPTPRVMGRFALELYEGPTLIERVRFDFPMLGADADGGILEKKLRTRIGVLFPATPRGTRLELWDRARDQRWPLPWPAKEGVFGSSEKDGSSP